jgi:Xaa-Pro aminopeptidase
MNTFDQSGSDSKPTTKQTYDTQPPANLVSFMLKDWKPVVPKIVPVKLAKAFKRRRDTLSKLFPGDLLVIPTGHQKIRSNDTFYPFRAGSDFFHLTGNHEPDCVLVLAPEKQGHRQLLFVDENFGKTNSTFFTDRIKGELWEGVGVVLGVPESAKKYGIECLPVNTLETFLADAVNKSKNARVAPGFDEKLEDWSHKKNLPDQKIKNHELAVALSEMRLIKDDEEIREMSQVIKSTKLGFEDVIRRLKTAQTEREVEGVFYTRARTEGNDVGYGTIAASGEHACTLHWKRNDGKIRKTDLLLLDAGVEGHWLYTADITRTLPIGGKFSREQRIVYDLVYEAQLAAFKQVKPGNDFMAPNQAAMKVLTAGLVALGILKCSAEEALKPDNHFYRRYTLHNVSHMLGIDVHDCAQARAETYKFGKLQAGMVLTVEPGLYFQPDDLTVPPKFRGIGVRIEDDVVVTSQGHRNLSGNIPREASEVEKWIQTTWKKKG